MPRPRRKKAAPSLAPAELREEAAIELPDRHAMSLLSGMPALGGADMLGGTTPGNGSTTPAPAGSTATPSPSTGLSVGKLDAFDKLAPVSTSAPK